MDLRSFKKRNKRMKAQERLEELEEELSPAADHVGKSKVKGNEMMRTV